jgi:hypothetical protein
VDSVHGIKRQITSQARIPITIPLTSKTKRLNYAHKKNEEHMYAMMP